MAISVILYAVVLVIIFLFWILYRGVLSLQLFVMAILLPIVLFVVLLIQKSLIRVKLRRNVQEVAKGEPFQWIVQMQNRGFLPIPNTLLTLEYQNRMERIPQTITLRVPLLGCNVQRVLLTFHADCCGVAELKLQSMRIYDPLRLFSFRVRLHEKDTILIMPSCAEDEIETWMPTEDSADDATEYSKTKPGDDPSEVFEIHEYRSGDAVSRIHWKLSSKLDELIVKEYSLPIHADTMILPDFSIGNGEKNAVFRVDMVLSVLYAISNRFRNDGRNHSILWYQQSTCSYSACPLTEPDDTEHLLRQILHEPPSHEPLAAALDALSSEIRCTQLILIVPKMTDEVLNLLPAFAEHRQLTVFYMLAKGEESSPNIDQSAYVSVPIRISEAVAKEPSSELQKGDEQLCAEKK